MDRSRKLVYTLGSDALIYTLQMAAEEATPRTHFATSAQPWVNSDICHYSSRLAHTFLTHLLNISFKGYVLPTEWYHLHEHSVRFSSVASNADTRPAVGSPGAPRATLFPHRLNIDAH